MKISNLKITKKVMLLLMAGTLGILSPNLSMKTTEGSKQKQEKEIDIDKQKEIKDLKISSIPVDENNKVVEKYDKNKFAYTKKKINVKENPVSDSENIKKIDKYQKVKLIEKEDNWDLIKVGKTTGYIKDKNLKKINKEFIEVDISDQKLKFYDKKGNVIIKTDVVTGLKNQRDTILGYYEIYYKQTNRILKGANYRSHVDYWMPFCGGYGLHDADWRGSFGDKIYTYDGSHGCVNMPDNKAKKLYKKAKVGTKVLIHK